MRGVYIVACVIGLATAGCFNPKIKDDGFKCVPGQESTCPSGFYCVNQLCQDHPGVDTPDMATGGSAGSGGSGGGGAGGGGAGGGSAGGSAGGGGAGSSGSVDMAKGPADMAMSTPPDMTTSAQCGQEADPCSVDTDCCSGLSCLAGLFCF